MSVFGVLSVSVLVVLVCGVHRTSTTVVPQRALYVDLPRQERAYIGKPPKKRAVESVAPATFKSLQEEIRKLSARVLKLESRAVTQDVKISGLVGNNENLTAQILSLDYRNRESAGKIAALEKTVRAVVEEVAGSKNARSDLYKKNEELKTKCRNLADIVKEMGNSNRSELAKVDELSRTCKTVDEKITAVEDTTRTLGERITQLEVTRGSKQNKIVDNTNEADVEKSTMLESRAKNLERQADKLKNTNRNVQERSKALKKTFEGGSVNRSPEEVDDKLVYPNDEDVPSETTSNVLDQEVKGFKNVDRSRKELDDEIVYPNEEDTPSESTRKVLDKQAEVFSDSDRSSRPVIIDKEAVLSDRDVVLFENIPEVAGETDADLENLVVHGVLGYALGLDLTLKDVAEVARVSNGGDSGAAVPRRAVAVRFVDDSTTLAVVQKMAEMTEATVVRMLIRYMQLNDLRSGSIDLRFGGIDSTPHKR